MNLRLALLSDCSPMRNVSRDDLRLIAHQRAVALGYEADAVAKQQVQAFLFKQGGYCTCCECEQDDEEREKGS